MNQSTIDLTGAKLLIVEDNTENLQILRQALEAEGYQISGVPSGEIALRIAPPTRPDLILLDIMLPGIDGFQTCRRLKQNEATADTPVIFITAKGEVESIILGFEAGAVDYITKPFQNKELYISVETHLKNARLTKVLIEKNTQLQQEAQRWGIPGFVAKSQTMAKILAQIRQLHGSNTTHVLIQGESGTGKERIARAIHFGGPRAKYPFIPLNCSAIPAELAESLLFGHRRGAFTGAETDQKGYFELALGGTLFLDEISDLPPELQAKLLRVLEDGSFMPIGGTHERQVEVCVLSATNTDVSAKVAAGEFRRDLYYRLAEVVITVPPLRERPEDTLLLVAHFIEMFASEMGKEKPALSPDALSALMSHSYPGNVRELKNIMEWALIESAGGEIRPEHLHFTHAHAVSADPNTLSNSTEAFAATLPLNLQQAEDMVFQRALY